LLGGPDRVAVERGLGEFRSGRPLVFTGFGETALMLPIDGITDERLAAFRALCEPSLPHLAVTARRARALGIDAVGPIGLKVKETDGAAGIFSLAADAWVDETPRATPTSAAAGAGIEIAKLAHLLPALLVADCGSVNGVTEPAILTVGAEAVAGFRQAVSASLTKVAEADVPLAGGIASRFVVFRDAIGGTSVAVVVGKPDLAHPVPVRLHSSCLTGDVFGSRRCDCGDQLRMALARLHDLGGGIILYLDQEGRGLGLPNKMRAYRLQDAGLDTLDANAALGFDDDERDYGAAVRMLRILGCHQVQMLTNNPLKLDGLSQAGVDVTGRIALHGPVNPENRRYLTAKATRSGHKLDHLLEVLAETPVAPGRGGGQP
jgi:GTP cyclohydrolase II